MAQFREAGGGSLPVAELIELVGVEPDPALLAQLQARGALEITFSDDGSGAFQNTGPTLTTHLGPAKLTVPREIAGSVKQQDGGLTLVFDQRKTMCAKVLFLELRVQRLEVSEHHVAVHFPGGAFDQEYRF